MRDRRLAENFRQYQRRLPDGVVAGCFHFREALPFSLNPHLDGPILVRSNLSDFASCIMLALPKKTDYALIALYYLMERPDRIASAREIAELFNLPCALLMNVMKDLQQGGLVRSSRGAKGGYQLAVDPGETSLYDVLEMTSGPPALTECCQAGLAEGELRCQAAQPRSNAVQVSVAGGALGGASTSERSSGSARGGEVYAGGCPIRQPLQVLHNRLVKFLTDVKLTDLLTGESVPQTRLALTAVH